MEPPQKRSALHGAKPEGQSHRSTWMADMELQNLQFLLCGFSPALVQVFPPYVSIPPLGKSNVHCVPLHINCLQFAFGFGLYKA